jgi:hypothetical protein
MYIIYCTNVKYNFCFPYTRCSSGEMLKYVHNYAYRKGGRGECLPTTQIPAYPTLSSPSPESLLLLSGGRVRRDSMRGVYDHFLSDSTRIIIALVRWKS